MEPLIAAIKPYLPEGETYFFRPDKFYFELNVWETDFEDRLETYIKISDLRFAIEHGFNLTKHVMEYIDNMPKEPGYLEPILAAFRRYIKFLRMGIGLSDGTFNISNPLMSLGVEETAILMRDNLSRFHFSRGTDCTPPEFHQLGTICHRLIFTWEQFVPLNNPNSLSRLRIFFR